MKKGILQLIGPATVFFIAVIIVITLVPIILVTVSPELMLLFKIAASLIILNWVRNTVGPGMLAYVISGILIYIFVFIMPQFTLGLYVFYMLLITGVMSTIIFAGMLFPMKPLA